MKKLILLVPALFPVLACQDRTPDQAELRVMAEGAALHGANGINFGPDGNLYVASVFGMEIVAMDPGDGTVMDRFGPEAGVAGPDDLVFGPDGSLYWTDIMKGEVGRRTPGGVVTKQMVAPGVNPVTFSPDGRLFVALDFLGDGLYELDPGLVEAPRPIIVATPENPYPLGFLNGFAFGPDGRLYGPIVTQGMVVSIDVDSCQETSTPWEDCDLRVAAADFVWPAAAKFDPQGRLHVVDQTGEVFRVDVDTGEKTVIAILEPGLDNLAFDSGGSLYVSSADHGWVAEILPSGQARTISPGGMIVPMGVAVLEGPDGSEVVFVADAWRLREFDGRTGQQESVYKGYLVPEVDPPSLTTPVTLSADGDRLVVSSWLGGAVQVWDPQTDRVTEHYPMPVPLNAIRFQDDLVVADLGLGGVVWASDHGMILPSDGVTVLVPAGLATDGDVLWVADWATGTVWQIGFDGRAPLDPVPLASGLANPEGMAVDRDGSLLVVETGAGRLSRIDPTTGGVSVVTDGLEPGIQGPEYAPPTLFFDGVAVGPSGAIYVTDNVNNALLRIRPR